MTYPPWQTRLLRIFIALVLVCLVGWYSPLATAAIWRLFHPFGWVDYRGLRVRVPWPWIADAEQEREDPTPDPQGLGLKKTPFAVNKRANGESIFVTVISQDPGVTVEQQTADWMRTFRATHPGASFNDKTPVAVPLGAGCLQAESSSGSREVVWTCISVHSGWVANYEGHTPDAPVFFEIVNHLKS